MPATSPGATAVKDVLTELESFGDEKRRQYNAKAGPDGIAGAPPNKQFGCKTSDIRKLAKRIKTDHELGLKLWKTGNMDAQLLATLIMNAKELSAEQLDRMVREARFAWVADWLQAYIIKGQPDDKKEKLREKWMKKNEKDRWAARAGWHLTASKINNGEDGVDVETLLDRIEKEMPRANPETKWTMNNTLGAIGIKHAKHRKRAITIGEKIGLYEDWPVSKGCTIPYVPVWVAARVKGNS
ncbi:MAG: DNA alkylation repair protein [Planctomycetaceae bacterium]|nr:DNA alkylation repair protein [Planctomycetaceae bacterium]|tara:strand:+ start:914 stop:1636 length:723 start_codon:yes stop_codon:yes gene_type:complete